MTQAQDGEDDEGQDGDFHDETDDDGCPGEDDQQHNHTKDPAVRGFRYSASLPLACLRPRAHQENSNLQH